MSKSTNRRVPSARRTSSTTSVRSTGSTSRARPGRERTGTGAAAKSAAAGLAGFRSRHPVVSALVPVALVVVVIATMVIVKVTSGSSAPALAASRLGAGGTVSAVDPGTTALAAGVAAALEVPGSTLDEVGSPSSVVAPSRTGDSQILRGADGKPVVTYIGAEYCPYCAAERWSIAVALSRFGTFSNLSGTHSASNDVYPNTQTLSFYGSQYSSAYLDFEPVEEATNQVAGNSYATLQRPTAAESDLLARFDAGGSIPFLDIGNKYVVIGASYSPQVLAGLSQSQIAGQLANPSSPVAQAVDGAANEITAAITQVTGEQPASIANSPAIASIAKSLGA
jgi:thiol-disulfide isomerase/thioredoxin